MRTRSTRSLPSSDIAARCRTRRLPPENGATAAVGVEQGLRSGRYLLKRVDHVEARPRVQSDWG